MPTACWAPRTAGAGNDSVSGADGNDTVAGCDGADSPVGGTGSDMLDARGADGVRIETGSGSDVVRVSGYAEDAAVILGSGLQRIRLEDSLGVGNIIDIGFLDASIDKDVIDLSAIDADVDVDGNQAFALVAEIGTLPGGPQAQTVIRDFSNGTFLRLYLYDGSGGSGPDDWSTQIIVDGVGSASINSAWLIL